MWHTCTSRHDQSGPLYFSSSAYRAAESDVGNTFSKGVWGTRSRRVWGTRSRRVWGTRSRRMWMGNSGTQRVLEGMWHVGDGFSNDVWLERRSRVRRPDPVVVYVWVTAEKFVKNLPSWIQICLDKICLHIKPNPCLRQAHSMGRVIQTRTLMSAG